MIFLTRLNQSSFVVNSDLIEHIEVTPDTLVALTTGEKFLVLESADEIIARTVRFRRSILGGFVERSCHESEPPCDPIQNSSETSLAPRGNRPLSSSMPHHQAKTLSDRIESHLPNTQPTPVSRPQAVNSEDRHSHS